MALMSGMFAALGGAFGKVAFSEECNVHILELVYSSKPTGWPIYILQGIFIILTISTNGIMMVLFFRALAGSETTFLVTAMNSAANFATTALIGYTLFGESFGIQWFVGMTLIIVGVLLLNKKKFQAKNNGKNGTQKDRKL